jgi:hypothetical protein
LIIEYELQSRFYCGESAMIRRQHVVQDFFDEAQAMREALDMRFRNTYADRIAWHYFCDPKMYTYLRAASKEAFPEELFNRFMKHLRSWCMDNLGLVPMDVPLLHLMVNGCRLGLHSDFHNGAWGYVFSLTRWQERKFSGGETLLLRDGVPSYKKHHVHGEVLYELIPAYFNQLLVFDDRIVHATPTIEGSMDPQDGRIALVGHIRATSPNVAGSLGVTEVRTVMLTALTQLRDRVRGYKEVQGTVAYRLSVGSDGAVDSTTVLTDNLVTANSGYGHSDAVATVKSLIQQTMRGLKFSRTNGPSVVTVAVLIPLPELTPIRIEIPQRMSQDAIYTRAVNTLECSRILELRGSWDGYTFTVSEPIAGTISVGSDRISANFDAPMWVPSQRESFQSMLTECLAALSA